MIECRHIDFSYDSKTILQGIDLNIENGEFLCILGQSGCGKSTLLRLLAGLERPSAGEIRIDGEPVAGPDRHCSVVFQDYSLFPWMTTGANLTLALHAAYPDKNRKEVKALAESYLETVGLGGSFGQYPEALSGGLLHQTRCKSAVKACRLSACLYKCARSAVTFRAPERIIHRACGCAPAPALSPSRAP